LKRSLLHESKDEDARIININSFGNIIGAVVFG